jgi:hypothetical protein
MFKSSQISLLGLQWSLIRNVAAAKQGPLVKEGAVAEVTFSADLKCGNCIAGGYIFCTSNRDYSSYVVDPEYDGAPTFICAEDADNKPAPTEAVPEWFCSDDFTDMRYALAHCPWTQAQCGDRLPSTVIDVDEIEREDGMIDMVSMNSGDTCTIKTYVLNGIETPWFAIGDYGTFGRSDILVSYVEWYLPVVESPENQAP